MTRDEQAEKLEEVREHLGFDTLKSFWEKLSEGWAESEAVSYTSVRNYHRGDKKAPAAYYGRISKVFPEVNLEWLVNDRGPMLMDSSPGEESKTSRRIEQASPAGSNAARAVLQQLIPRLYLREKRRQRAQEARDRAIEEARKASEDGEPEPVDWPDVERPSLKDVGPVPVEFVESFVEEYLDPEHAVGTYGEREAAMLNQLAVAYIAELGSSGGSV